MLKMKLMVKAGGMIKPMDLSSTHCYASTDVENMLQTYVDNVGNLSRVFIDFSGENIPLTSDAKL